jgi:hypothetical protein
MLIEITLDNSFWRIVKEKEDYSFTIFPNEGEVVETIIPKELFTLKLLEIIKDGHFNEISIYTNRGAVRVSP